MSHIYRRVEDHAGQVKTEDAYKTIQRLEKQTGKKWMMDYSDTLEDNDVDYPHPVELSRGYCWIVRDYSK